MRIAKWCVIAVVGLVVMALFREDAHHPRSVDSCSNATPVMGDSHSHEGLDVDEPFYDTNSDNVGS
jgi:hypothetical protein